MGLLTGGFTLPMPQRTSQLVNDSRFSSIQEYLLDSSSLSGLTQLDIADLKVGSVIYRIDLVILSAFRDNSGSQHNIEISCGDNVLMASEWNDPNRVGTYTTNCYGIVNSTNNVVHIKHSPTSISAGSAILRIYSFIR